MMVFVNYKDTKILPVNVLQATMGNGVRKRSMLVLEIPVKIMVYAKLWTRKACLEASSKYLGVATQTVNIQLSILWIRDI